MEDPTLIALAAGPLEAMLAPEVGGCIARFDFLAGEQQRFPVLRGAAGVPPRSLDAGCFPLVPYCNRIRGGAFRFRGRELRITPNMPPDPSPLHGQGWQGPWAVASCSPTEARLVYRHSPSEWPWRYEAVQIFVLDPAGLTVRLGCTNRSEEPMPCGLGLHPYFPCTAETRLDTKVAWAWTVDENVLPVARVPAEGRYRLRDRLVCGQDLDNGFGGWEGKARIETPGLPFRIEMSSSAASYFQLYSPLSGGLIVAEPVTHANAALNEPEESWPGLGLRILQPGESMELAMRMDVIPA
jgi:aldose 1-epimerase